MGGETKSMTKRVTKKLLSLLLIFALVLGFFPNSANAAAGDSQVDFTKAKMEKSMVDVSKFINKDMTAPNLEKVFISPDINTKSDKNVKVIVELTQEPVSVDKSKAMQAGKSFTSTDERSALTKVEAVQSEFTRSMKTLGVKANVSRSYKYVLNGFAIELPAKQVPMLAKAKNVKAVYPVIEYTAAPIESEPMMSESGPFVGSTKIWDTLGFRGEGIKVGVVDTGIDYLHPDLKDVYVGGYDFVNNDADPYETTPGDRPADMPEIGSNGNTYWTSHGTHVSGTIAAQGTQANGVMGIAPGVELYAYKVLGPYGSGATDWILAGVDKAVQDGMDVINLSLGASLNDPDYPTSIALNNAMLAGTVAVTSAGNSGPERWTLGSPGASAFAITVGASTPPGDRPLATGQSSLDATLTYDLNVMAFNPTQDYQGLLLNNSLELVYVGLGYPEDYANVDVTGKIAFIKRGELAFVDKIAFAKEAGAAAAIIFNRDELDGQIGYFLGDSVDYLPTFDMSGADGRALLAAIEAANTPANVLNISNPSLNKEESAPLNLEPVKEEMQPVVPSVMPKADSVKASALALAEHPTADTTTAVTFTITGFDNLRYEGDEMADFSSRGPVKKTLDIKPDVVAPGVSIRSTVAAYGKEDASADYSYAYERYQGTSMASPHVAALAALIKQAHPEYTTFDIKAALMNNAKVLEGDLTVFDQGSGRVQGYESVISPVIAEVYDVTQYTIDGTLTDKENITGSINFGHAPLDADFSGSRDVVLRNLDGADHTYTVSAEFLNTDTTGVTLAVNTADGNLLNGGTLAVTADSQASVQVTVNVDSITAVDGEYQGYIYFKDEAGFTIHVPFVVFVGELDLPKGFGSVFQDPVDFSPNGDGVLDTQDIYFQVYSQMDAQALLVWDPVAYDQGFNDGYIGQILYWDGAENTAPPGFWRLGGWDGWYWDYRSDNWELLNDGYYTLDWYGWDATSQYVNWNDSIVDTRGPYVHSVDDEWVYRAVDGTFTFEGSVSDMYVWNEELNKVSVSYELVNNMNGLVEFGDVTINPDGTFALPFTNIPDGINELIFYTEDVAGNTSENWYFIVSNVATAAYSNDYEAELGGTFQIHLTADGVENLVGAQFGINYDDSIFTLEKVEASPAFVAAAGDLGIVELTNNDLGYSTDGMKQALVGAAYKGEVEGLAGKNEILTVTFSVTNDLSKVGSHLYFEPYDIKFVDKTLGEFEPNLITGMGVEVIAPLQKITGTIQPEAFMENGALEAMDFTQIGAQVMAENQFGEVFVGTVNADGTFVISGLSAEDTYTLQLSVPGHFRSILENVRTVTEVTVGEEVVLEPTDITVDFGLLLAGDTNGDDVVDIWDVVSVARFFTAEKATDGTWVNPQAAIGDINQDGVINVIDLSYVTEHFGFINELVPYVYTTPLLQLPNGEQFDF